MLLKIETAAEGDTLHVTLSGEFDMDGVSGFRKAVEDEPAPWQRAEIEMSDVVFMDSSGLQELVRLNNRARERGLDVVILRPSVPVTRLLELTGLDSQFTTRD